MPESKKQDFLVTARKWRPRKYDDVVGQSHITKTLKNSIKSDRIHHANLFTGPRGVGKTTTARIHAIAINSHLENFEPDLDSDFAKNVIDGRSMDVMEIDGASNNSVDDIRKLRENAKYPPAIGKYKVYIIDEVHMLSDSAFNALLKILEEPPKHLIFIFATTEPQKIPATIISRCQRYDFRRMEIEEIVEQLKKIADAESIEIDEESLNIIARKGDGSMRDSQSVFDQARAFCGSKISSSELADALNLIDEEFFFRISDYINAKDLSSIFGLANEVSKKGYDFRECISGLIEHYRNALLINVSGNNELVKTSSSYKLRYEKLANEVSKADLLRYLEKLTDTEQEIRFVASPRIKFETTLVYLASLDKAVELKQLLDELKNINLDSVSEEKKKHSVVIEEVTEEYSKPEEISRKELKLHYKDFLNEVSSPDVPLGMLKNIKSMEIDENKIKYVTDKSFIYENLSKNKKNLESLLSEYFSIPVSIDLILDDKKKVEYENSVNEIEKYLIDNFNATKEII